MKSLTTKLMVTAAALAIAAGVASAQTYRAEIPFSFQAAGKLMSPGGYVVRIDDAQRRLVIISNFEARQTAVLLSAPGEQAKGAAKSAPSLAFECGMGRCALARLWTGSPEPSLAFPHRRLGNDEHASLTEIRLVKTNGD